MDTAPTLAFAQDVALAHMSLVGAVARHPGNVVRIPALLWVHSL
ncbi:MAG TPA: hypothetical protein VIU62_09515 [Chloroflexota bacterium]